MKDDLESISRVQLPKIIYPHLIQFPSFGNDGTGILTVGEYAAHVPFEIKRLFWTYNVPPQYERGDHAHFKTEQILISLQDKIRVAVELPDGSKEDFVLTGPATGVYIPPHAWHTMYFHDNAILLVLASTVYSEDDYIRTYEEYENIYRK
jgi:hypothetical protein